jgi:predicted DNA binding protein
MKIIKFQIPRAFLLAIGLKELFVDVTFLEIVKTYQYDAKNFFSMQRIVFQPGIIENLEKTELMGYLCQKFHANHLEIIERPRSIELLVIMRQQLKSSSWIPFESGPWALLFPIVVDPHYILTSFIIQDSFLDQVKGLLERVTKDIGGFKVLAQTSVNPRTQPQIGLNAMLIPKMTTRQREIATYATRNGFFHSPKRITAKKIGIHFEISESAINHNLRRVQQILMHNFFGEDTS